MMIKKLSAILTKSKVEGELNEVPGVYIIRSKYGKLLVIASNGMGWDHISVSRQMNNKSKIPSWEMMCYIKDLFFDSNETVIQFHPKRSEYVNINPNVLHLWKNQSYDYQLPPIECV
jgi:hypothetical protein